jgi:hypothetical protein
MHNAASISLICMRTKTLEDVYTYGDVGLTLQHLCEWCMEKALSALSITEWFMVVFQNMDEQIASRLH